MLPRSEYAAERMLAFLYTVSFIASFVVIICTSIIWLHWRVVLNTCAGSFQTYYSYYDEKDCGCFLWGKDTLSYFVGSDIGFCYWAVFGLILTLLVSFCYGSFHVYRHCCRTQRPREAKMHMRQRSTEIMQLTVEQDVTEDEISPYFWTPAVVISFFMFIYCFVHAIMLTDGIFATCKAYRNRIIKNIHGTGQIVGVIQSRLTCGAVFDFMDYLHEDLSFERRRDYRINTGIPAWLAIFGSWIAVFCWIGIFVITVSRYRQSRGLRV